MIAVRFHYGFSPKYHPHGLRQTLTINRCFRDLSFVFFVRDSTMAFHAGFSLFFVSTGLDGKMVLPFQRHSSASWTRPIELPARNSLCNGFSFFSIIRSQTI